jgi:hypothetical protein
MPGDEAYQATKPSKFFSRSSLGAPPQKRSIGFKAALDVKEGEGGTDRSLGSPRVSLHSANYDRPAAKLGQR